MDINLNDMLSSNLILRSNRIRDEWTISERPRPIIPDSTASSPLTEAQDVEVPFIGDLINIEYGNFIEVVSRKKVEVVSLQVSGRKLRGEVVVTADHSNVPSSNACVIVGVSITIDNGGDTQPSTAVWTIPGFNKVKLVAVALHVTPRTSFINTFAVMSLPDYHQLQKPPTSTMVTHYYWLDLVEEFARDVILFETTVVAGAIADAKIKDSVNSLKLFSSEIKSVVASRISNRMCSLDKDNWVEETYYVLKKCAWAEAKTKIMREILKDLMLFYKNMEDIDRYANNNLMSCFKDKSVFIVVVHHSKRDCFVFYVNKEGWLSNIEKTNMFLKMKSEHDGNGEFIIAHLNFIDFEDTVIEPFAFEHFKGGRKVKFLETVTVLPSYQSQPILGVIIFLIPLMVDILENIEKNVRILRSQQTCISNANTCELSSHRYTTCALIGLFDIAIFPLPKIVCTSERCVKYELRADGNDRKATYLTQCQQPEIPHVCPILQGTDVLGGELTCMMCPCTWAMHMYLFYDLYSKEKRFPDYNFPVHSDPELLRVQLVAVYEERIHLFDSLKSAILLYCVKFAGILMSSSIVAYYDTFLEYLDVKLRSLRDIAQKTDYDINMIERLEMMRASYLSVKGVYATMAQNVVLTEADMNTCEQVLCNLEVYGVILKKPLAYFRGNPRGRYQLLAVPTGVN